MSHKTQNPISHNTQNPVPPNTLNPVLHNTQNTMSHNTLNPVPHIIKNPGFKIIEHPADTGMAICASSIENLFEVAAEGMFSIICDTKSVGLKLKRNITIRYESELKFDDLLILWLEKLLYIHETSRILFSKFEIKNLKSGQGMTSLKADIYGEKIDLKKHKVFISIKSPTYHKLEVSYDAFGKCWFGHVIFDV
jgi:SHS2 domain-containing protein